MPAGIIGQSVRRLVAGSGNVTIIAVGAKPWRFSFVTDQTFHRGETVAAGTFYIDVDQTESATGLFTISHGVGKDWHAHQLSNLPNFGIPTTTGTHKRTDHTTSRLRGGSDATPHRLVPGAAQFLYVSPLDGAGLPDWYTYVDTVFPVNGRHPYTRDRWTGQSWITKDDHGGADGKVVPDAAKRISDLDGGSEPARVLCR